ncbi:MAG: hypothetical protein GX263_08450 [Firmicutes bacterium]|jgi:DNA/RNA-binding domain of Phe-tRNA-synthetase-like protein|nr:hypothetical protein [Bacillota bacterium]
MKFCISQEIFNNFPNFCVAVIVGEGIDNTAPVPETEKILATVVAEIHNLLKDTNVRERKEVAVWREAFQLLGINPNKYPSSIEALLKRIAKKPQFPGINSVVNLVNSVGIKNMVPIGAHDMDKMQGDIQIRFSREGDLFTPFGSAEQEEVPPGEPVYADDLEVRTRMWVWRQGEKNKITPASSRIFFPIDGFNDATKQNILSAGDELAHYLNQFFQCSIRRYWVDKDSPQADLEE